jgi:hypothetical protein
MMVRPPNFTPKIEKKKKTPLEQIERQMSKNEIKEIKP